MANKLKEWRISKNYTQKQLAEILGVSRSRVANIESGCCSLSVKLAKILAKDEDEILYLLHTDNLKYKPKEK